MVRQTVEMVLENEFHDVFPKAGALIYFDEEKIPLLLLRHQKNSASEIRASRTFEKTPLYVLL